MQVKISGHGAYRVQYHVVWVTKYRRNVLNPGVEATLRKLLPHLLRRMPGTSIETLGFDPTKPDHIHMVMIIPPKYAIADAMAQVKAQSASLRKKYPYLAKVYWKENIFWSPGYFASSVGLDEATIKHYVEYQGKQDSDQLELEL
jgi:putative transposase